MSGPVFVLGGHQTDFAKVWSRGGQDLSDMMREAIQGAVSDSRVAWSDIGVAHVGNAFGELYRQQAHLGALVAQVVPELWGVPAMRHEGACASSSLAILVAMAEIEAGRYDCALVVGAEEEKNIAGDEASRVQNAAAWQGREDISCRFMWPAGGTATRARAFWTSSSAAAALLISFRICARRSSTHGRGPGSRGPRPSTGSRPMTASR